MNKFLGCLALSLLLTACNQKTLYLTPESSGFIYDNKTRQPITNTEGYIGYDTARSEHNLIKTDNNGKFKIPAETMKYYFIKPSLKDWYMSAPHIYVQFPGYKTKIFDYSEGYSKVNLDDLSDEHTLKKLDVGIILLENEK